MGNQTNNKWNLKTLQSFCTAKDIIKPAKMQLTGWKKSLPTIHLTEEYCLEYTKHKKLKTNLIKKQGME